MFYSRLLSHFLKIGLKDRILAPKVQKIAHQTRIKHFKGKPRHVLTDFNVLKTIRSSDASELKKPVPYTL